MCAWDEKAAFNARAKALMLEFLRSKSWVEKVESIERMTAASKIAREAMRKAMGKQLEAAENPPAIIEAAELPRGYER
jgi:hypothetical protein